MTTLVSHSSNALEVPKVVAKLLTGKEPEESEDLAPFITDIQFQTQVFGANTMTIYIVDPALELTQTGVFNCDPEGGLPTIHITFDGVEYTLVDVAGTTDPTGPNLTLEFQNRGRVELAERLGPKNAIRGKTTRAEFIKARIDEVKPKLKFVCPLLHQKQTIAADTFLPSGNERAEEKLRGLAPRLFKPKKKTKATVGKTKAKKK